MTLEQFNAHKEQIRTNLQEHLAIDRLLYSKGQHSGFRKNSLKKKFINIEIKHKECNIKKLTALTTLLEIKNRELKVDNLMEYGTCSCKNKVVGVRYTIEWDEIREEIEEAQVEVIMKAYIFKLLNIHNKFPWNFTLDCKVMKLFKEGKIDWDETIKSHNEDCNI